MGTGGRFYGLLAVLLAALLVSVSLAGVYYGEYQQVSTQDKAYAQELSTAISSYNALAGRYNASLANDRTTLALLAEAVASLNTSTPAYTNASSELASLWSSYQTLVGGRSDGLTYQVHMLVDYGNGTKTWYNNTSVQPGWNGYLVTLVLLNGSIQATWYPQYGEHYVTGIGGTSDGQGRYWFLLSYNKTSSWEEAPVGVDYLPILNGTVFAWALCPENSEYAPACPLP